MKREYTIELPMYAVSIDRLVKFNEIDGINVVIYGGAPDSPLNGGRFNFPLDGLFLWDRLFYELSQRQLSRVLDKFYAAITKANQNGISFYLAYTNMFVSPEEVNDETLGPVKFLSGLFEKYGVKNGVIINNLHLEQCLRERYHDKILYISSCTKYVSADRILSPRDTMDMYRKDMEKYDYVVMTPQDSRREKLLKTAADEFGHKIMVISNSYCANNCNTYDHYVFVSKENKKSLLKSGIWDFLQFLWKSFAFLLPRCTKCPAVYLPFRQVNVGKNVKMQLNAGITNFKLGRGFGQDKLAQLVEMIREYDRTSQIDKEMRGVSHQSF